jgi:two-component sensor histidine kinase
MIRHVFIYLILFSFYSQAQENPVKISSIKNQQFLDQFQFVSCDDIIEFDALDSNWENVPKSSLDDLAFYQCYWGRIQIINQTEQELWTLIVGTIHMENVVVFIKDSKGQIQEFASGRYVPSIERPIKQGNRAAVPLTLNKDEVYTVYVKFYFYQDAVGMTTIDCEIVPYQSFVNSVAKDQVQLSFVLGSYLVLIFCALLLYITKKEKLYLYYLLYIFIGALFVSSYDDLLSEYVLGQYPYLFKYFWLIGCGAPTIYLLFMREFLSLAVNMRIFDKIVQLMVALSITALLVSLYLLLFGKHYEDAGYVVHYMIMGQMAFMLVSQFVLLPRIIKDYRVMFFVAGSICYLGTSIYFEIQGFGTSLGIATAALIEGLIFATGLGYRINQESKNKRLNLEHAVNERTEELSVRNSQLQEQYNQNEILMKELHHRVKNNLQMISSLLNMQQKRLKGKMAKEAMDVMKNRVISMGLIHEHLYKVNSFNEINLKDYVQNLTDFFTETYEHETSIKFETIIKESVVDIDLVIPIGLILNELITNSIKHAFEKQDNPKITIHIDDKPEYIYLKIMDNGKNEDDLTEGFGYMIIRSILKENGDIQLKNSKDGFEATIQLKKEVVA